MTRKLECRHCGAFNRAGDFCRCKIELQKSDCYEAKITKFESERSEAMEDYFSARPRLFRTREKECLFEAGFRMAWDKLHRDALYPTPLTRGHE